MNDAAAVDDFLAHLDHRFAAEAQTVREYILDVHPSLCERIKWKSPSFYVGGDDLGAFQLRSTEYLRLILVFPHGLVDDPTGLMLGSWADRRELRFTGADDVAAKRAALQQVMSDWLALRPDAQA